MICIISISLRFDSDNCNTVRRTYYLMSFMMQLESTAIRELQFEPTIDLEKFLNYLENQIYSLIFNNTLISLP